MCIWPNLSVFESLPRPSVGFTRGKKMTRTLLQVTHITVSPGDHLNIDMQFSWQIIELPFLMRKYPVLRENWQQKGAVQEPGERVYVHLSL